MRKALLPALAAQFLLFFLTMPGLAAGKKAPKPPPAPVKPTTATAPAIAVKEPERRPFKEATFLLPKGAKVEPRWVLPPTEKTRNDAIFSVNATGSPVLAVSGDSGTYHLLYPDKNYLVAVKAAISGITHLSSGALLLSAGNDLLLPAEPKGKTFDKKGVPYAALQPLTKIPLHTIEVLASAGNTVYCAGVDARSGRHALYLLRSLKGGGILDMELAYESTEAITAVTGDAEALYVAKGRAVVRYSVKDGAEEPFYTHPSSSVTGLANTPAGLVVSTGKEIVLAGRTGAMEIMRSSGHRIAMAGDTLYVLFNTSLGVLAIDNLADLKRFNLSVRPVAPGEAAPPLAISSVRFYESDSLDNTQGFAESFDRKGARRIVARIEFDQASLARSRGDHVVTVSWHEPNGGMLKSANHQVTKQSGGQLFVTLGGKTERGYSPPHWTRNGSAFIRYTDELANKYPGRYRMLVQVDGIAAGEWSFTLTGQITPGEAIAQDDLAALKTMLDQGLSAGRKSDEGEPLITTAVRFGTVRTMQLLLERGADPNATDKEGYSPLARAEYAGDWMTKAELLVRHGANVNAPRFAGGPPLVAGYSADFTAFLLKKGANHRYETSYGTQSIFSQGMNTCTDEILTLLVQRGADLNETIGPSNYSPLGRAIYYHADERCMQLLLDKGASTAIAQREPNRPPRSALYVALSTLDRSEPKDKTALRRIVRLLLQKGATFRPGKKLATSAFFDIPRDDYMRQQDEIRSINAGDGRLMFVGEGPTFFEPVDMIRTLEQDDAALEGATESKDPAIRELALVTHLSRVRELTARARDQYDMKYRVHEHCEKAFKLSEAGYRPAQVDVVPEPPGGQGKPQMGLKLLKRAEGGAYVQGVLPGGPAERAGLKAGDIILALDTQKMKDADEVIAVAAKLTPGMPVRVTFLRDEPMGLPDLQLTCGLVETEYKELWGYAEMNLSRWLAAHPDDAASDEVRTKLKELAAGGRK
ncbi:PDZ domain-containing protein [Geobacter hydrogenophilus]|uniref:PDZ domain-containing protein n=1 Tax=Geobacter hydrogenophilus TaxID=40983 RepID=UPI00248FEC5C|nr:PDZ domain-containing protein [Geobacter hydrogenophilus]